MLAELADDGLVDGIHLEGPGSPRPLRRPRPDAAARPARRGRAAAALGRGHIRQVTLAPERDHGLDLVRWLTSAGVHAAVGLTAAGFAQVEQALAAGADVATHLFNGMDPWHHREPGGAVPALLRAAARGTAVLELIADGAHVSDEPCARSSTSSARTQSRSSPTPWPPRGRRRRLRARRPRRRRPPRRRPPDPLGRHAPGLHRRRHEPCRRHRQPPGRPRPPAGVCRARPVHTLPDSRLGRRGAIDLGARADLVVVDESVRPTRVMRRGRWLEG